MLYITTTSYDKSLAHPPFLSAFETESRIASVFKSFKNDKFSISKFLRSKMYVSQVCPTFLVTGSNSESQKIR